MRMPGVKDGLAIACSWASGRGRLGKTLDSCRTSIPESARLILMSSAYSFRPGSDPLGTWFETVSSLTQRIKDTLEADFADVALHGEITNLARPKSGHVYFSLRDQAASIRAVMWKGDAHRLAFDLSDGLAVRVLGRLTLYAPRGDYQVVVRHLELEKLGK